MAFTSQLMQALSEESATTTQRPMLLRPELEQVITIDPDTRKMEVPSELKYVGVTGDHLAETIYFTIPRYFDGKDLSIHKCIFRYINAGGEYGEDDAVEIEILDDEIKFGWAIDNYVTRYSGAVNFTVQFETEDAYQWQTTPAIVNIWAGINVSEAITDKDDILFRTLTNQIQMLNSRVAALEEQTATYSDISSRLLDAERRIFELEQNVVYTLDEV